LALKIPGNRRVKAKLLYGEKKKIDNKKIKTAITYEGSGA